MNQNQPYQRIAGASSARHRQTTRGARICGAHRSPFHTVSDQQVPYRGTWFRNLCWAGCLAGAMFGQGSSTQAGDNVNARKSDVVTESARRPKTVEVRPFQKGYSDLVKAVDSLEELRQKSEEWGFVSISAPVVVINSKAFAVTDEILKPEKMYEEVKAERAATVFQYTGRGISNELGVTATPTAIPGFAQAPAGGTATTTTTSTTTSSATAPANSAATPATGTVPPLFGSDGKIRSSLDAEGITTPTAGAIGGIGNVTQPFSQLTTAPTGSVSDILQRTENNLLQQKIFSQMTKAEDIKGHSHVLFCIVQVSCNPGWRTKQNYIGDVSASMEFYRYDKKTQVSRASRRQPRVFSVLPLIDAQTIEMANSQREITQLAFQLAASVPGKGVDLKAKDLFKFVKEYARDARSITPVPVVNSYSFGGTFGFRFSPSFQALSDAAKAGGKPANVLLPRTMPALVTIVIEDEDMKAAMQELWSDYPVNSKDNEGNVLLPPGFGIMTHISTRWYLKDRPPLSQFWKRIYSPMKRDTANMEINLARHVAALENARERLRDATEERYGDRAGTYDPIYEELRRGVVDLQSKGIGQDWPIPMEPRFISNMEAAAKKFETDVENEAKVVDLQQKVADLKAENTAYKQNEQNQLKEQNKLLLELLKGALKVKPEASTGTGAPLPGQAATPVPPSPSPVKENTDDEVGVQNALALVAGRKGDRDLALLPPLPAMEDLAPSSLGAVAAVEVPAVVPVVVKAAPIKPAPKKKASTSVRRITASTSIAKK